MKKIPISLGMIIVLWLCLLAAVVYFGVSGCRFLGLVILATAGVLGVFLLLIKYRKRNIKAGNVMIWLFSILLAVGMIAATATGVLIAKAETGSAAAPCDYIIVLGAGVNGTSPSLSLRERIDATYTYMQENPQAVCVVSGGQGDGENITEAQCMFNELTKMGIAESRIWLEDKADSTWKNIIYSLDLIETKTGSRPKSAGIVSSEYHLYRASLYAKEAGISPICIPAKTSWWHLHLCYFLREIFGVWAYYIF